MTCEICGDSKASNTNCKAGHFICDQCHSSDAVSFIERICLSSNEKDPIRLADRIMASPIIKMHGPEHHYLVPAVMLTVVFNHIGKPERKLQALQTTRKRTKSVLGGYCGFQGACGAAIGTGIFLSILTEATPLSVEEWQLSNRMTARALGCIADKGGPRCCKRDSFIAIREAAAYVNEELGIRLTCQENIQCGYNHMNRECITRGCDFYSPEMTT